MNNREVNTVNSPVHRGRVGSWHLSRKVICVIRKQENAGYLTRPRPQRGRMFIEKTIINSFLSPAW